MSGSAGREGEIEAKARGVPQGAVPHGALRARCEAVRLAAVLVVEERGHHQEGGRGIDDDGGGDDASGADDNRGLGGDLGGPGGDADGGLSGPKSCVEELAEHVRSTSC